MPHRIVTDTCCTINLLATQRELKIVEGLDWQLIQTPQVGREMLTLWTPPDADGQRSKVPVSPDALRRAGRLDTHPFDSDELVDAFVLAAALITDADASCIALAGVEKIPLLTDDRKQRRIARELFPSIEFISTLDVLADAARALSWSDSDVAAVARDLRWRGNFAPPRIDPRGPWYEHLLRQPQ
jgi:predicted nucleic acid-binding protein